MRKVYQMKKSTSIRISYILLNYILVIDRHLPTNCNKLKLVIPLEFCHHVFNTRSPKCLVLIKIVIVTVLKEITGIEFQNRQMYAQKCRRAMTFGVSKHVSI